MHDVSHINRAGRISRIAKQVRATQVALNEEKDEGSVCVTSCAITSRLLLPPSPSSCVKQPPAIPPFSSVCCIFSPFRGSNRVVDCSAAKGKANEDRDRARGGRGRGVGTRVSAGVHRLHVEKNSHHRKSTLASCNEETKSRRPLDAYRRARGSPPLYCSRSCHPFSRRTLPHGCSSSTKSRRKQKSGRRNEDGKGTSANEAVRARWKGRQGGAKEEQRESSETVEERKRVGKRDEWG